MSEVLSDLQKEFVQETLKLRAMNDEVDLQYKKIVYIDLCLQEEMAKAGIKSMKLDNGMSIQHNTRQTISVIDKAGVAEVLREFGHDDLMTVNSSTLLRLMRDIEEDTDAAECPESEGSGTLGRRLLAALTPLVKRGEVRRLVLKKS